MLIKQLYNYMIDCWKYVIRHHGIEIKKAFFTRLPWHGHLQNAKQLNLEIACLKKQYTD